MKFFSVCFVICGVTQLVIFAAMVGNYSTYFHKQTTELSLRFCNTLMNEFHRSVHRRYLQNIMENITENTTEQI